mmetsp:Transcript_19160/g.72370  ORF Transcript_19160/g.72370 Transcript_19160/m.72370 type:complete len:751 (-) Transcript_19160:55-2307(-)
MANLKDAAAGAVCMPLEWTDKGQLRRLLERLQADSGKVAFDVVVGTDLLYYRTDVGALLECAAELLFGEDDHERGPGERPKIGIFLQQFRVHSQPEDFVKAARQQCLRLVAIPLAKLIQTDGRALQLSDLILAIPASYFDQDGVLSASEEGRRSSSSWQGLRDLVQMGAPFDPTKAFDDSEEEDEEADDDSVESSAEGLPDVAALLQLLDDNRGDTAEDVDADVVVVGAGLAGLGCARELARKQYRVLILEAKERPGGRVCPCAPPASASSASRAGEERDGFEFDAGAAWIHGTEGNPIAEMLRERGTRLVETSAANPWMHPQFMRGNVLIYDSAAVESMLATDAEKREAEALFRSLAKQASSLAPPPASFGDAFWTVFDKGDHQDCCSRRQLALLAWNIQLASLWFGRDLFSMAPDTFASCFLDDSPLEAPTASTATARPKLDLFGDYRGPHCKPVGGMRGVVDALVGDVVAAGGAIQQETVVSAITSEEGSEASVVEVATSTGKFRCKACVLTSSVATYVDSKQQRRGEGGLSTTSHTISTTPDLPKETQRIVLGKYEKLFMRFEEHEGLSRLTAGLPFLGLIDQQRACERLLRRGPVAPHHPESVNPCMLFEVYGDDAMIASLVGEDAEVALTLGAEALGDYLAKHLNAAVQHLHPNKARALPPPLTTFLTSWSTDRFCGGSYSDVATDVAAEEIEDLLRACRRGAGAVFLAGEALHPEYMGSVHGAFETGLLAAADVVQFLGEDAG